MEVEVPSRRPVAGQDAVARPPEALGGRAILAPILCAAEASFTAVADPDPARVAKAEQPAAPVRAGIAATPMGGTMEVRRSAAREARRVAVPQVGRPTDARFGAITAVQGADVEQ